MQTRKTTYHGISFVVIVLLVLVPFDAFSELRKWNKKMQQLSKTFQALLPEIVTTGPISKEREKELAKNTAKLLELAHTINMGPNTKGNPLPPEADPTISFVSGLFEREVKLANYAVKAGHTDYAKAVLRNVSGYCIACHTRHDRGPDFPSIDLSTKTASLTTMEKAELLAATRQFDAALEAFESVISDKTAAEKRQFEWGRAVRNAFNISIRVKKDPDRAIAVLDRIVTLPKIPGFFTENIPGWRKSILEWKVELPKMDNTEDGLLKEAKRLSKEAQEMQEYAFDHSADILYLRSSALVHELLSRYPDGKHTSEALYLAGAAYDLLEDRLLSTLPNMYYESCIRSSPHSAMALKCYRRYEQNVLFGWTGSRGTAVPDEIQSVLNELAKLARK